MKAAEKFTRWVDEFGRANLARELNITWGAVHQWYRGATRPKPEHANRIIELSKGKLKLEDLYRTNGGPNV